ncbi:MAG: hypothetical protein SW127_19565, partial [Actinomycetota bacterium]|nr:hypothetical protein [Actinomycetota bacterium]
AESRERTCKTHRGERLVAKMFNDIGIDTVLQKACGPYNIDIFVARYSIAVELFGGHWHSHGLHAERFRKRFDYILNCNFIPVIVWVTRNYPVEQAAIDKIVAIGEESRHNKAIWRTEHVIRGDGNVSAIGQTNLDYLPGVV